MLYGYFTADSSLQIWIYMQYSMWSHIEEYGKLQIQKGASPLRKGYLPPVLLQAKAFNQQTSSFWEACVFQVLVKCCRKQSQIRMARDLEKASGGWIYRNDGRTRWRLRDTVRQASICLHACYHRYRRVYKTFAIPKVLCGHRGHDAEWDTWIFRVEDRQTWGTETFDNDYRTIHLF